jgi:hypothetical protein
MKTNLTSLTTCKAKQWLITVASNAKALGELILSLSPVSSGGSAEFSLTVI